MQKYNNKKSAFNGCYYVTVSEAKSLYSDSPKRAASQILANSLRSKNSSVTSSEVYRNLYSSNLLNGTKVYFYRGR